jgi:hypothetical protein
VDIFQNQSGILLFLKPFDGMDDIFGINLLKKLIFILQGLKKIDAIGRVFFKNF